jgi:hypothetical protein
MRAFPWNEFGMQEPAFKAHRAIATGLGLG